MDKKKISEMIDAYLDANINALARDFYQNVEQPTRLQTIFAMAISHLPLVKESPLAEQKRTRINPALRNYLQAQLLQHQFYPQSPDQYSIECFEALTAACENVPNWHTKTLAFAEKIEELARKSKEDFYAFKKDTFKQVDAEIRDFVSRLEQYRPEMKKEISLGVKYRAKMEKMTEYGLNGEASYYAAQFGLKDLKLSGAEQKEVSGYLGLWDFYNFQKESGLKNGTIMSQEFMQHFNNWLIFESEISHLSDFIEAWHGAKDIQTFLPTLAGHRDVERREEATIADLCSKVGINKEATLQTLKEIFLKRQL